MNRKEYIEKLKELIVNRVKFHAPVIVDECVDYSILDIANIDASYPIFLFEKPLNKLFFDAFFLAKKEVDFILILTHKPCVSKRKLGKLKQTIYMPVDEMGTTLSKTLHQLNINYQTHSTFVLKKEKEYVKFNGKLIQSEYIPYYYYKKIIDNGVVFEYKNFLLNGKNYFVNMLNTKKEEKNVEVDFYLPLPRGYYTFKKEGHCIKVKNLTTKETAYFNHFGKNISFCFSNVSGIENSTFPCIRFSCKLSLRAFESKKIFFSFNNENIEIFNPKDMENLFKLSQDMANKIFDVKIVSKDASFDDMFNRCLPQIIWEKWMNFDISEESENKWLKIKNKLLKNYNNGMEILQSIKGLKEVKFYHNLSWKRVFIVHSDLQYMFIGRIKYYNYNILTEEIFDKNDEIYLSFAS